MDTISLSDDSRLDVPTHASPAAPPPAGDALVEARDLTRIWGSGDAAQIGVRNVDLSIGRGELVETTHDAVSGGARQPESGDECGEADDDAEHGERQPSRP